MRRWGSRWAGRAGGRAAAQGTSRQRAGQPEGTPGAPAGDSRPGVPRIISATGEPRPPLPLPPPKQPCFPWLLVMRHKGDRRGEIARRGAPAPGNGLPEAAGSCALRPALLVSFLHVRQNAPRPSDVPPSSFPLPLGALGQERGASASALSCQVHFLLPLLQLQTDAASPPASDFPVPGLQKPAEVPRATR